MTTTIVLAGTSDGYVVCNSLVWDDALNGVGATAVNGTNEGLYGAENFGGYFVHQTFIQFAYTRPANELEVGVALGIRHSVHRDTSTSRTLWVIADDWSTTVDAGDWITPFGFVGKTRVGRIADVQASGTAQYVWCGSDELVKSLRDNGTSTYKYELNTDRQTTYGLNPGGSELSGVWMAETSLDPTLIVSSVIRSSLYEVLGAQVQLSDGTWAVLESDGAASPTILLRHVDFAGTATTKATVPVNATNQGFRLGALAYATGSQQLTLIVDASDNLYVIGWLGSSSNDIAVKAYVKGPGYTWTAMNVMGASLPSSDTDPTNFAAAWHAVGPPTGIIMLMVSRGTCDGVHGTSSEMCWVLISAVAALTASGYLVYNSGNLNTDGYTPTLSPASWAVQTNDTGTGLDVVALAAGKGIVHTWSRRNRLGANQPTLKARYIIQPTAAVTNVFYDIPETSSGTWGVKTAAGKLRAVPVAGDQVAVVAADPDVGWGLTVAALRNPGTTNSFTLLGRVLLGGEGLTTMPAPATLAESQAWDAIYLTGPNKIWVYYFDTANGRRLMRTAMSLNTYTATREEIQVNAAVGAVGSTNPALRVARGAIAPRRVLVTVANRTAGGALSTIYLVDTPNEAPTAPILTPHVNYDASAASDFMWTFTDPDLGDTQTGFEIDINTSLGVDYYDSGNQSGTITYVGIGAKAESDAANLTPALPAGWTAGDLLVILATTRDTVDTVDVPAGWTTLKASGTNVKVLGRIARTGDVAPTITFTGDAAGDTNIAQCAAWRGTDQNIATVLAHSAEQLNGSAVNVAYPACTITTPKCALSIMGWRQDDQTSVAGLGGMTEICDSPSILGNDAGIVWDTVIQTTATSVSAGSLVVTGSAAVSRGLVLAFRPHQTPLANTFTLPANTLTQPGAWQWRVRTWDEAGLVGAWSGYSTFSTGAGGTVTITDPAIDNPPDIITSSYTVSWSVAGAVQADFRIALYRTDTGALVSLPVWVTSTATSASIINMVSDVEYRVEVTVRTALLVESQTGTRLITPSYAVPDLATITVLPVPTAGYTLISVSNPATSGSRPDVVSNQIIRRAMAGPDMDEDWVVIGETDPNGTWTDYTAASNILYEYAARAVAADDSTITSEVVEGTLCLAGIWIHDPDDPDGTIRNYPYGTGRSDDSVSFSEGLYYAGRMYPVYDFGDKHTETLTVPIQVPFISDTWREDVTDLFMLCHSMTTLCLRDARGRRVFGVVTGVSRNDQSWGTVVQFDIIRVDYDQTTLPGSGDITLDGGGP